MIGIPRKAETVTIRDIDGGGDPLIVSSMLNPDPLAIYALTCGLLETARELRQLRRAQWGSSIFLGLMILAGGILAAHLRWV